VLPTTGDAVAGVSVALVLIPQSVAYATLAGARPEQGLIVGCVATIAAAPFVSSRWLQTGPVAITSLLTFGALATVVTPGSDDYVALVALLALLVGVIRVAIGLARAGVLAYLMSQPVLAGFTPAAAVVIAASQVPALLGAEVTGRGIVAATADAVSDAGSWDLIAVALGSLTIVVVLVARKLSPLLPGVLIAVGLGLAYSHLTGYAGAVVGPLPAVIPTPSLRLPWSEVPGLLVPAAVIAIVGFAEAGAIARTFAAETGTRWDADREFVSQGIANLAAGTFGGFPAGGSFSRSALNRTAGARTAWSGAITGVTALAFLPFAVLLERLPISILAGIIIAAVVGLADVRPLLRLRHLSRLQFSIAAMTFVLTIVLAPQIQWAVVIGVLAAVLVHLRRELMLDVNAWTDGSTLHLRPYGVLYFGSADALEPQLDEVLGRHPDVERLVVHFDGLGRVDVTGAIAVRAFCVRVASSGVETTLTDFTDPNRKIVLRVMDGCPGVQLDGGTGHPVGSAEV
jgi:sulfate permease, SulP family